MENPKIKSAVVDANEFPELSAQYGVSGVPHIVIHGKKQVEFVGAYPEPHFVQQLQESLK